MKKLHHSWKRFRKTTKTCLHSRSLGRK